MNNVYSWSMKGWTLVKLGKYAEAAQCYFKAKYNVLDTFLGLINSDFTKSIEERKRFAPYLKILLQNDDFFISETKQINISDIEPYMNIYIRSMEIISLLNVDFVNEEYVSHYTNNREETIDNLLIKNLPLWLSLITKSNDPKEGQTLLDYFYKGQDIPTDKKESIEKEFGVFSNCFTFNHDHLNQFRLYGKGSDGTEAGGISIVINQHYFSTIKSKIDTSAIEDKRKADAGLSIDKSNKYFKNIAYGSNSSKLPLFRCIYIDPYTGFIASIGQREEYTFYQTKNDIDKIDIYHNKINSILKEIREQLKELKNHVRNLDPEIVSRLLLALRYLTKNVSFKEEQECRIFQVELLEKKTHIDYLGIREYIQKLLLGTNFSDRSTFINEMKKIGIDNVELSKHLFNSK